MSWARASALLFGLGLAACSTKPEAPNPPGLRDANGQPIRTNGSAAPPATPRAPAPAPMWDVPVPSAPAAAPAEDPIAELIGGLALGDAGAGAPTPRDLAAEVSARLDPRGACLDLARVAQGAGRITLGATVTLLPSGRISRAVVSAPGQPAEARTCLEQRLLAAQLRANVPDAPRSVSATFTLEVSAAQPAPRAYAGPERAAPPDLARRPELAQPDQADVARPDPGDVAGAP